MWIGVDDTDGPEGGCTTWVLTEIVRIAGELGFDLIGRPRLVRLDPNVPWKTRGNGALAARFGHGSGVARRVGQIGGRPVRFYARGHPLSSREGDRLFEAVREGVGRWASPAPRSDPAVVGLPVRPTGALYRTAVSEVVPVSLARKAIASVGGRSWVRSGSRGLVGATAAIAWPGRRKTFELLAYRSPAMAGQRRQIDPDSVHEAAERFPSLFQCEDPRTRRLLVAPHTPCPILFGLRGRRAEVLPEAMRRVRSEPIDRWMVFESNQGTGDHLKARTARRFPRFSAGWIDGTVAAEPISLRGGHVRLEVRDVLGDPIVGLAYEPTKLLPAVARSLRPGDRLRLSGGRGAGPTLGIERIGIRSLVPRFAPAGRPACPDCHRKTRSLGKGRGFRCPRCRARFPPEAIRRVRIRPSFGRGTYDPTPSARRHLHPIPRIAGTPTG